MDFHEQMMTLPPTTCTKPFTPKDFWKDMGWLNIPLDRQATFIEPLYPRGGLLGGSPDAVPKMSRLQALAAARKKKAQEQKSGSVVDDVAKPMAALGLGERHNGDASSSFTAPVNPSPMGGPTENENIISFSARKRKSSSPHRKTPQPLEEIKNGCVYIGSQEPPSPSVESAAPSAFATTMFGDQITAPRRPSTAVFTLSYLANPSIQSTDAFAGPSPDDVVIAAQSKGAAHPVNGRK
jgi:elongation factor 1 alpha-like protein